MSAHTTVGAPAQAQYHTTYPNGGTAMSSSIHLNAFSIYNNGDALHYTTDADELCGVPARKSGNDEAAVLVRLDVDGDHTSVIVDLGGASDVTVLSRTVDALADVLRHVLTMVPQGSGGRCMTLGDWGRCRGSDGHDGEHTLPTEAEWTAERKALGKPYPRSA